MKELDARRMNRTAASAALIVVALLGLSAPVSAGTHPLYPNVRIISADDVLRDHTETAPDGTLFFVDARGAHRPLVTSTSDPRIANAGDGSFHAVEEASVLSVLGTIRSEFLAFLSVDIYLLPYPRAGLLSSGFDGEAIYLSPGCLPYSPAQAAGLIGHELGHAVHHSLLPDTDTVRWAEYETLRGIADSTVYWAAAAHANRPHEIFAEDFRVLYGGALAAGDGSVENPVIGSPLSRPDVQDFFESLVAWTPAAVDPAKDAGPAASTWTASPNPSRPGQAIVLRQPVVAAIENGDSSGGPVTVVVFDAGGREVSRQAANSRSGLLDIPTRDAAGRELAAGAYWARVVATDGSTRTFTVSFRRTR